MSSYEALTCRAFGYSPMAAPTDRQTLLVLVVLHYACWVSQHFHVCQKSVAAWSTVPLAGTEGHLKSSCCVFFLVRSISQAATSATHVAEHCRATVVVQRQALGQSDFALTKTKGVEPLPRGSTSSNSSPRLEVVMSRKGCT